MRDFIETKTSIFFENVLPALEIDRNSSRPSRNNQIKIIKESSHAAMRIFSLDEQMKLTKASYQFIVKIGALGVIPTHMMELIMNRLFFSDSRFVSLQETKWTIRSTLAQTLDPVQLAFLELVLYFKEDGLSLH